MIVIPVRDACGQFQLRMAQRETSADIALRAHVSREGRQALEELSLGALTFEPVPAIRQQVEHPMGMNASRLIDPADWHPPAKPCERPGQHIPCRTSPAYAEDT